MRKRERGPVIKKTLNLDAKLVERTEKKKFEGLTHFTAKVEKGLELLHQSELAKK